ncbi:putative nucleic acid-binding Zn-ribbon protein [Mycetocola sp. CAN_C7]|uniref:zinc ribbon domain-containing protein n=1 Tax=Mycetocola sp. CAN_C7 TaxID=2787724 RepID=UPI0018C9312B
MKSSHAEQKKLLDLQNIDSGLARVAHRERSLPEIAEHIQVSGERTALSARLAAESGVLEDAKTELGRLESDAAVVDARIARDTDRVTHSSSVKDVTALESELESLYRRKNNLEDMELVVMERVEQAESQLASTQLLDDELQAKLADVAERRSTALDALAQERAHLSAERGLLEDSVATDLLALYEKLRTRGGTGAALFRAGTCGACTITLTGNELQKVRAAEIDEVLQCPECSAIMVRTEESGLW